jgi:hypothetical protein
MVMGDMRLVRNMYWVWVLGWLFASPCFADIELIDKVTHPAISEMSGIVRSSYPGVFWVHNDSGDSARLFAITPDAQVITPRWVNSRRVAQWEGHAIDNAWHNDWEAIAMDAGVLYLADVGNNDNARRDLGVYVVDEPNPRYVNRARARSFLPIRYPDQTKYPAEQWHFDCEAVFTFGGKLYFLTKHRKPGEPLGWEPGSKLYRLDTAHTDRDNVLTLVDQHALLTLATGADVSPDGSRLAVVSYVALWIFEKPEEGDHWLRGKARVIPLDRSLVKQNEAVGWETNETLLITNENREIFRFSVAESD